MANADQKARVSQLMMEMANIDGWRCSECGEPVVMDSRWRRGFGGWEHHHGYPVGHIEAQYFPKVEITTTPAPAGQPPAEAGNP